MNVMDIGLTPPQSWFNRLCEIGRFNDIGYIAVAAIIHICIATIWVILLKHIFMHCFAHVFNWNCKANEDDNCICGFTAIFIGAISYVIFLQHLLK